VVIIGHVQPSKQSKFIANGEQKSSFSNSKGFHALVGKKRGGQPPRLIKTPKV